MGRILAGILGALDQQAYGKVIPVRLLSGTLGLNRTAAPEG
jgi:hypothetical protein